MSARGVHVDRQSSSSKRKSFEVGRGVMSVFLDVFNLYNRTNLRSYGYDLRLVGDQLVASQVPGAELLPLLPSLGIRWEF